jgi:methionyl-tRNA synthetase
MTDIFVRAQRLMGKDVLYICADDTHGTPIELNARKAGVDPEDFVARFAEEHVRDLAGFGVQFDSFYSTNSLENRRWVEEIYEKLQAGGHVERRELEQLYDEKAGRFLPDRFVKGTCPFCKTEDQYGDVCENCKKTYSPTDLINPYSVVTESRPVLRKSTHLFVGLAAFSDFLREWTSAPGRLQPEVKRFVETRPILYPVVVDPGRVSEAYGVYATPTVVLVGAGGRIRARHVGPVTEARLKQEIEAALAAARPRLAHR